MSRALSFEATLLSWLLCVLILLHPNTAVFDTPSRWILAINPSPVTTLVQHRLLGLLDIQSRAGSHTSPVPSDLWQEALATSGIFTPDLPSYYGSYRLGDAVAAPLFLATLPPRDLHRLVGASSVLVGSITAEMRVVGWRQEWQATLKPTTFDDDEEAAEEADEDDFEDLTEDMFSQLFGEVGTVPQLHLVVSRETAGADQLALYRRSLLPLNPAATSPVALLESHLRRRLSMRSQS